MTRSVRIHEFGGPEVLRIEDVVVGDRVALVPAYGASQYGLYGESSLSPSRSLVSIPDNISFVDAAATWVAFGMAWSGLVAVGALTAAQSVVISAASSSVGLAAIQIARLLGVRPIALTRTSKKTQALLAHGAAAVVAADEQNVVTEIHRLTGSVGANLVFDAVGGPGFAVLAKSAATGGTLVLYGALDSRPTVVPPFDVFARNLTIRGVTLPALARDDGKLAELKRFVSDGLVRGALQPTIARTFSLKDIADAHRFIESGEQFGKTVVTV